MLAARELRTRTGEAYGTTVAAYLEQWLSWKRSNGCPTGITWTTTWPGAGTEPPS